MTQEEKAKAYDKAIKIARKINSGEGVAAPSGWTTCEVIFPELRESEDEKIRKALIDYFNRYKEQDTIGIETFNGIPTNNILAWLEKLGKNNMGISEATKRELEDNLNKALEKETPESCNEFLEKQGEQKPWSEEDEINRKAFPNHYGGQKPADKVETFKDKLLELFQKFRWKGTPTNGDIIEYVYAHIQELINTIQKPAWSEEDEIAFGDALWCCKQAASIAKDENEMGNAWYAERWLKALKDRVQPQQKWKPSDKQIEVLRKYAEQSNYDGMLLTSLYNDLNKLREK